MCIYSVPEYKVVTMGALNGEYHSGAFSAEHLMREDTYVRSRCTAYCTYSVVIDGNVLDAPTSNSSVGIAFMLTDADPVGCKPASYLGLNCTLPMIQLIHHVFRKGRFDLS